MHLGLSDPGHCKVIYCNKTAYRLCYVVVPYWPPLCLPLDNRFVKPRRAGRLAYGMEHVASFDRPAGQYCLVRHPPNWAGIYPILKYRQP